MCGKITSFKELRIWQQGIRIVKDVYKISRQLPKDENYGLITQMRRAAVSIPSNIAEGFKRYHPRQYRQHLYMALGSAAELETQLIICNEIGYCSLDDVNEISERLERLAKQTNILIKRINSKIA
jgi:four helix bundle protein